MKFNNFSKNTYKYFYLTFSLIVTFWFISLFEIYMTASTGSPTSNIGITLGYKLLNDFWAALGIGLLFLPIFFLTLLIKRPVGIILIMVLFTLVILGQFSLMKYGLTTRLNLGADLLGYSMDDIKMTVVSSESFSFLYFLPFIVFPIIFLSINYFLNKYVGTRQMFAVTAIIVILFGSLKLVLSNSSANNYQNKLFFLVDDIIRFQNEKREANAYNLHGRNDYPFLKPFKDTKDVLGPFFNIHEEKPNIVIIIVEGLGSEFVGDYDYAGFTPFLDSLIPKSLYWKNFICATGRSFGVMPALLGSLPYGEMGFLELNPTPTHISLISVLKANGYTTSYYAGHQASFDRKINFLEYNGIDHLIDEDKFGPGYFKTNEDPKSFSWGYPDAEIFRKTLSSLDGKKLPRLDIVRTQTNHEPFDFPSKEVYIEKIDSILNSRSDFGLPKEEISAHKDIFASVLYTDNSIKYFMDEYSKRPEFKNTIFIITGDHRLIPLPQKNKLCRYQVPLFIYSPLLKKAVKFNSISSHLDVTPSLLSFLMNNYKLNKLKDAAWLGEGIDTVKHFRNIHQIPLMRYKGSINDFIYKDYFLSEGELYKIDEHLGTYKITEVELLKEISDSFLEFKKLNAYVTKQNRIFPDSLNIYTQPAVQFTKEELATIKELTEGLNFDETFMVAREFAFDRKYKKAKLLCNYILNELPNYGDVRTLKGRILAWEGKYENAEIELLNVVKRSPYYEGGYSALLDLYWWSEQDEKAIEIAKKVKENEIKNPDIGFKLAKAYQRMNNLDKANKLIDSILQLYPNNENYKSFKKSIN